MASSSLWEKFQALPPAADTSAVAAIRVGITSPHLLVQGCGGEPVLLLATMPRTSPRADIRLKHVAVFFDRRFEVANSEEDDVSVGTYCKFTCDQASSYLHQYFVELMAATAKAHSSELSQDNADSVVDALLELFRKLTLPPERSVSGLWGELLLIHLATSPSAFVDAWHLRPTDGFDFAFSEARIEVKTSERPTREHEFALRQVKAGRPGDLIASIIISRSSAGLTVLDLTRLIADRIDDARQEKLWRLILETLGDDTEACEDQRFDLSSALESLVFVSASDIPAPDVSVANAPFVTDVKFRSNISSVCATSSIAKADVLMTICC